MITRVDSGEQFGLCLAIYNEVCPDHPCTLADMKSDGRRTLLLHGGEGYALSAPSSSSGSAFTMVRVRPGARRRGIGSALLEAATELAREQDAKTVWGRVEPDDAESRVFLARRGFRETAQEVALVRTLAGDEGSLLGSSGSVAGQSPPTRPTPGSSGSVAGQSPPTRPTPGGVVELRDEHLEGARAVTVECVPDMPTGLAIATAGPYDQWRDNLRRNVLTLVALEHGEVVGLAELEPAGAVTGRLEHGLTAVLRSHRGRGLATKLKRAQIAWAAANGYRELITWTQEGNDAMRRVSVKLGYVETPGPFIVERAIE